MGLKRTPLTAIVLLLPMIHANTTMEGSNSSKTQLCPYTENPFYLDSFEVPEERDPKGLPVNTKEVLVLHWIDKEHVGCELNHNEGLKSSLYLSCSAYRCNISNDCNIYLKGRMDAIKAIVKHNLIVTLKAKALQMFGGIPFKQVVFKDKAITDMPDWEFFRLLNTTMYRLSNGLTVPNKMQKVSSEDFEDTFKEGLYLYHQIESRLSVFRTLPGSSTSPKCTKGGNEKCNDAHLERLYKIIAGDQDDVGPSGNVHFGYSGLRRTLEQGVRYIIKSLGKKDAEIRNLRLPMIPPCFQHTG